MGFINQPIECFLHRQGGLWGLFLQGYLLGGSSHLVGYNPSSFSGLTLLIPLITQGYNPLSKWDEPPSKVYIYISRENANVIWCNGE